MGRESDSGHTDRRFAGKTEGVRALASNQDLEVIGYGTAGPVSAAGAALVERDKLGGDCLYRGCVPTKALAMSAHVASLIVHSEGFGTKTAGHEVDFPAVMDRM